MTELFMFDFDGTLAHRPGMWTQCLLDVLDEEVPGHTASLEALRPGLRDGFPWHRPDVPHSYSTPDAWWSAMNPLFHAAYTAAGIEVGLLPELARRVRESYCDSSRFLLYEDTVPALELVKRSGARSVILSNHVPELPRIVERLGLGVVVDEVFTSAVIGFEKPNREAFLKALGSVPAASACMIGDNPIADVAGATAVGLRGVLVRHRDSAHSDLLSAVAAAL